jgi:hypothetical protein
MWMNGLGQAAQWYERLLVFAEGDPFEWLVREPAKTSRTESVAAVLMLVSVVVASAGILMRMLL